MQVVIHIASYTNPSTQTGDELFNLVTEVVISDEVKRGLCAQSTEGDKQFVTERIQKDNINLWSTMKKRKFLTWKSTCKKIKVTVNNKIVELQENRSLFARMMMMMVCQTWPEINVHCCGLGGGSENHPSCCRCCCPRSHRDPRLLARHRCLHPFLEKIPRALP